MLVESVKRCSRCGSDKPLSLFYRNSAGSLGYNSACKACNNVKKRQSMERFRSAGTARIPARKRCAMCAMVLSAESFSQHSHSGDGLRTYCKECDRVVRRSNKYGLTRERVVEMLRQTQCEACGCALVGSGEKHIDHRHSDGAVRGVLCEACNTTLGKCRENPAILMGICDYIARTRGTDYRFQPYVEQDLPILDSCSSGPHTPDEPGTKCQTKQRQNLSSPRQ